VAIRTLSLCSGIGGLEIGAAIVLGDIVPVCYVERELSVARILAQRMEDGALPAAPIWSDLASFDGRRLRGLVDIVTAGFPCPDYSFAGKRAGRFGKHGQVWEEVVRIVREVESRLVFLENVPGILAPHPADGRPGWIHPPGVWYVFEDLAESGYDAEWLCLRASDVGAPHHRNRWFCLAWRLADGERLGETVPDPGSAGQQGGERSGFHETGGGQEAAGSASELHSLLEVFPPAPDRFSEWAAVLKLHPHLAPAVESGFRCVADGIPVVVDGDRADQIGALGNAVVPLQAAVALALLLERAGIVIG
jgi:DNA (cytosine-5)-methyltransferase 1